MRWGQAPSWLVALATAAVGVGGCTSDEWPIEADDDTGGSEAGDDSGGPPADAARLQLYEPQSPSIHYLGEPMPLSAEVLDELGLPLAHEDIVWNTDAGGKTLFVGDDGEVELEPGAYQISATARFDDGSRLVASVGGIYVQSRWTGTYEGTADLAIAVMFQGIPLTPHCTGPIALVVDYDGEGVVFSGGSCTLNAIITTLDLEYTIEGTFANGAGHGTIEYDIAGFIKLPFDWTGAFVDDAFHGGFAGVVAIPLVGDADGVGTFVAPLSSPYLEESP
ncbi:MAG: hypothetical protein IPK74_11115 [Deltaproteobacteria bacterium]|nr:hypothetical protein [Deltaproteobacteria bacterium]